MSYPSRLLSLLGAGMILLAVAPVQAVSPALQMARQLNEAFVEVAESASRSVVVIYVQTPADRDAESDAERYLEQVPEEQRERLQQFMDFFRERRGGGGRRSRPGDGAEAEEEPGKEGPKGGDEEAPRKRRGPMVSGQGSGMVLRADGYILTNNHVVEGAEEITVALKDGREFKAEIRGRDKDSDLAVLKLKEKVDGLVPVRFADSDKVRVGEFAIAIGAPFHLDYSVTFGHVSAKGREVYEIQGLLDQDFIQTDANINMGNSGGPLVNIDGEVIGVNSMIRTTMGAPVGIGFSIPSNMAREIGDRLIKDGRFPRSWLGIRIEDLRDARDRSGFETSATNGVLVRRIESDGPAEGSNLRPADVIVAVDGKATPTTKVLRATVSRKAPGSEVTLDVVRGDEKVQFKVKAAERPDPAQLASAKKPKARKETPAMELGMTVRELTDALAEEYKVEKAEGVIVTAVEPGSLAAQYELKPGDIVTDINHVPVTTVKEFREEIRKAKGRVLVSFVRDGDRQFEVLKERSR